MNKGIRLVILGLSVVSLMQSSVNATNLNSIITDNSFFFSKKINKFLLTLILAQTYYTKHSFMDFYGNPHKYQIAAPNKKTKRVSFALEKNTVIIID